jgi:hypothetical protein
MYAPQSTQLTAQRGSRALPAIMSAIVILAVAGAAFGVRSMASQGAPATIARPQYDSPALRNGGALATIARPQYDSPALRGGTQSAVVPAVNTFETSDSLRLEHLGIAPATVVGKAIVTGRDRIEIHRQEHLRKGATSFVSGAGIRTEYLPSAAAAAQVATSFDSWDSLRTEHLGGAAAQAPVVTSFDNGDLLPKVHLGGAGR